VVEYLVANDDASAASWAFHVFFAALDLEVGDDAFVTARLFVEGAVFVDAAIGVAQVEHIDEMSTAFPRSPEFAALRTEVDFFRATAAVVFFAVRALD
jgi:hypothetical protein